jgi:hypothetical protein
VGIIHSLSASIDLYRYSKYLECWRFGQEQSEDYFCKIDRSASWSSDLAGLSERAQTLKSSRKYF